MSHMTSSGRWLAAPSIDSGRQRHPMKHKAESLESACRIHVYAGVFLDVVAFTKYPNIVPLL